MKMLKNLVQDTFFYKIRYSLNKKVLIISIFFSVEMTAASDIDIKDEPLLPSSDDNEVGYARFIFIMFVIINCYVFPFAIVLKYAQNKFFYVCKLMRQY